MGGEGVRAPRRAGIGLSLALLCLFTAPVAFCEAISDWRGYAGIESRVFLEDQLFNDQHTMYNSFVVHPEYHREWDDGYQRLVFAPFLRVSAQDDRRTHADIREFYYERVRDEWEFRMGVRQIFWGVTESQHLVDIVNQTDLVENIDTEDKFGQPMMELNWVQDWGTLKFFLLPYFRERTFPGREGRLRGPEPVEVDEAEYESSREQWHTDFAVRYQHYVGEWDFGLSYFYGTSRDPRLEPRIDSGGLEIIPVYDLIHQFGADVQWTHDAWLWKFEGITREGQDDTFSAVTAGFEYTFFGLGNSDVDFGILAEWLYDSRGKEGPSSFDNDFFIGARLSPNDIQGTQLLVGAIVDPDTLATFATVEGSRRLGSNWRMTIEGRFFANTPREDPGVFIENDDYIEFGLAYFF